MHYVKDFDNSKGFSFQRTPNSSIYTKTLKKTCDIEYSYKNLLNELNLSDSVKQMIENDKENAIFYFSLFNLNYNAIFTSEEFSKIFIESYNKYIDIFFEHRSIYDTIRYYKSIIKNESIIKNGIDPINNTYWSDKLLLSEQEIKNLKEHLLSHINEYLLVKFQNIYQNVLETSLRSILDKFYSDYTLKDHIYIDKHTHLPYKSIVERNMSMFFKLTNSLDLFTYSSMYAINDLRNLDSKHFNTYMIYKFITDYIICKFEDNDHHDDDDIVYYYNFNISHLESHGKVSTVVCDPILSKDPYFTLARYIGGMNSYYLINDFLCATIEFKDNNKDSLLLLKTRDYNLGTFTKDDFYFKIINKNDDKLFLLDIIRLQHIIQHHSAKNCDLLYMYLKEFYNRLRDIYIEQYKNNNFSNLYNFSISVLNDMINPNDDYEEYSIDEFMYNYVIILMKMEIVTNLYKDIDKLNKDLNHSLLKESGFIVKNIDIPDLKCNINDRNDNSTIVYLREYYIGATVYNCGEIYYNKRFFQFKLNINVDFCYADHSFSKNLTFIIRLNTKKNLVSVTLSKRNRSKFNNALVKAGIENIIRDILLERFMNNFDNFCKSTDDSINGILSDEFFPYLQYDGNIVNLITIMRLTYMI